MDAPRREEGGRKCGVPALHPLLRDVDVPRKKKREEEEEEVR